MFAYAKLLVAAVYFPAVSQILWHQGLKPIDLLCVLCAFA
jgi:hypothetical protein